MYLGYVEVTVMEGDDLLSLGEGTGIGRKIRFDGVLDVDVRLGGGTVVIGDGGGVVRNRRVIASHS